MRGVRRVAAFCVTLALALAPGAVGAQEPAAAGASDDTSWGLLVRGGSFGLPDAVANELFRQHPKLAGHSYGAELRYHGDGGGRGVASIGFAIETATVSGDGIWQPEKEDRPAAFGGEVTMTGFTVTGYWSLFPSWYAHPYVGLGLGVAYLEGEYRDGEAVTTLDTLIPTVHIPLGLAFELGPGLQLALEARVLNGVAAGGALQVRF